MRFGAVGAKLAREEKPQRGAAPGRHASDRAAASVDNEQPVADAFGADPSAAAADAPFAGQASDVRTEPDDGFDDFVRESREPLIGFLRKSLPSYEDAQDLAQETLMRVMRYRGQPPDALRILMYRIAINALSDRSRRHRLRRESEYISLDQNYHAIPSPDPSLDHRLATEQELAAARAAILQLPKRSREVYLLNRINGMSYAQIAVHCGISVKAVERNIGRALSILRARMKEHGYGVMQG